MLKLTKAWIIASLLLIGCGLTAAVYEQVNTTTSQTLTNKTLTAPAISAPVLSGTATGTYTLAGTPTIVAPTFSGTASGSLTNLALTTPAFTGSITGTYTLAGTPTITAPTISAPTFSGTASGSLTDLALTTPTATTRLTITSPSLPVLRLNTTHGSNFASQIQFSVSGTSKFIIAEDINQTGTNDLTFYDAVAATARLIIGSTGAVNVQSNDVTSIDELAFTDATANATAAGRLRRNGTALTWHDGTTANVLRPTLATPQASTSGTSIDFTAIPAGTRRIIIEFVGVGTSGTDDVWVQLGDAGGIEATGYLGSMSTLAAAVSTNRITTAFATSGSAGTAVLHGTVTLTLENAATFTWVKSGTISRSDADWTYLSAGSKSLSAELDRVRITTGGGLDTFDAGAINIVYE